MTIEKITVNGIPYLRIVRTYRTKDKNGKSTTRKEVIKSLGAFSKYDDGRPGYLERLKQSFAEKKPIIPELLPYIEYAPNPQYTVTFTVDDRFCCSSPKNFAPCILDPVFSALGLDELFASIKHRKQASLGFRYAIQGRRKPCQKRQFC